MNEEQLVELIADNLPGFEVRGHYGTTEKVVRLHANPDGGNILVSVTDTTHTDLHATIWFKVAVTRV